MPDVVLVETIEEPEFYTPAQLNLALAVARTFGRLLLLIRPEDG